MESDTSRNEPQSYLLWPMRDLVGYSCFVAWVFVQELAAASPLDAVGVGGGR